MSVAQPPEGYQLNPKRMTAAGIRPLPPDDPNETPDQRASRIRSFYKEYFDPSKAKEQNATKSMYFGEMEDAPVDSIYGAENVPPVPPLPAGPNAPFAEPMPRRAMTPPPRMPHDSFAPPSISFGYDSRPGSRGTARSGSPSVRVESSVSNRYGPIPPPPRQQKRRPPPAPLQALPTPHKMTDDSLITLNPLDFAPPSTSKAQREGRPSTPQSGRIPYVPPPAHTPLVSSYDDLAIMPSPHNLRKSTTFTALDFAPPPRFGNDASRPGSPLVPPSPNFNDGASSRAPSAASTRTGAMSPAAVQTLRSGANRVSRLPPSMVGTVDDMSSELKPKWDIGR
ncbi:hypothetical protein KEM55_004206 [Ascosphaera atra]|nr:hypothetical protein KEM55_004206 [Ascosphaera atra]